MSSHVAPYRWADYEAGRIQAVERQLMDAHRRDCERCAAQHARVIAARMAMAEIAASDAPSMQWGHIGARIHWSTSSERRARARRRDNPGATRAFLFTLGASLTAAAGLLWFWFAATGADDSGSVAETPARATLPAAKAATDPTPITAAAMPLHGVVTYRAGNVLLDGNVLDFNARIGPGSRLSAGPDSEVWVQFGPSSAFALAADSSLVMQSFDQQRIEIAVEGTISMDVAKRSSEQHLAVVAGQRRVVVRGTAFRVDNRAGALDVACTRGKVVVADSSAEAGVAAGSRLQIGSDEIVDAQLVKAIAANDAALKAAVERVTMLSSWTDAATLMRASATLGVIAPADVVSRVDGIEYGSGSYELRVMSGRHQVGLKRAGGNWNVGEWVSLRPGTRLATVPDALAPRRNGSVSGSRRGGRDAARRRREQIRSALRDDDRVRRCLRPLRKVHLVENSYLVLGVGVNRDGSWSHLNIVDSDLPRNVASCIRDVVDLLDLPAGPRASFRYRIEF